MKEKSLRNLKAELVALVAIVFRLGMLDVAQGTIELIAVVRRHMGIARLHVLGFVGHDLRVVALHTLIDRRIIDFLFGTVAHFALDALFDVTIGPHLGGLRTDNKSGGKSH